MSCPNPPNPRMKNPNENCLKDFRCPKCDSFGPFNIAVICTMEIRDDGSEEYDGVEWKDGSFCQCKECAFMAKVKDFTRLDRDKEKKGDPQVGQSRATG